MFLNRVEKWVASEGKSLWAEKLGDTELEYYPHTSIKNFSKLCFNPLHKKGAINFIGIFILPTFGVLFMLAYLGCCRICCCLCYFRKGANVDADEGELIDQEVDESKKQR